MVCKLLKALYKLKQSLWLWYERVSDFLLKKLGLASIHTDHNIFITKAGLNESIVITFVDDIKMIVSKKRRIIQKIKVQLIITISMVYMSSISF